MFENVISSMLRPRRLTIFALYAVTIGALVAVYSGFAVWLSSDYGELASYGAMILCMIAVNLARWIPD